MKNKFYVYVYLDQRKPGKWLYKDRDFKYQPFYVGKGTKSRDIVHCCPFMLKQKNHKSSTIKSIINDTGELPLHYRIYGNLTEMESVEIEKDFIKTFGRKDLGTGILCNHTDGGDGSHNLPLESRRNINKNRRKLVYQYSLEGHFIKKWSSLTEVGEVLNILNANISTAIKRGGTCEGYIWSYKYLGEKIDSKIEYQMPIIYRNIKQVSLDTGEVIAIHKDALHAALSLGLINHQARSKIIDNVNEKLKSAYGYYWTIKDKYIIPYLNNVKSVCQYTKDNVLVKEYKSMMDAVRKTGIKQNSIWSCCKEKQPYAGGYIWRYKQ